MLHTTPLRLALPLMIAMTAPVFAQDSEVAADTVVATVNGTDITVGHMLVVRARLPEQYQQLEDNVLFDGILDQLIQQSLLSDAAGELTAPNALILENEERALLSSQTIAEIARTAVTDEAVQAAYDETYANAGGEPEYNAAHILVETQDEAQAIVDELAGGADFATLAAERSTGPSGPSGGALGWFGAGMMVPPFEEAVVTLEPGGVSGPVQTQFGWHVIMLNDTRRTEAPSLDDVREDIVNDLQRQALEARLGELREGATITRPEDGAFDPAVIRDFSLIAE